MPRPRTQPAGRSLSAVGESSVILLHPRSTFGRRFSIADGERAPQQNDSPRRRRLQEPMCEPRTLPLSSIVAL